MVPCRLHAKIVADRLSWIRRMVARTIEQWVREHPEQVDDPL